MGEILSQIVRRVKQALKGTLVHGNSKEYVQIRLKVEALREKLVEKAESKRQ
jgi:hypothetical protein